jgi:hypothetical protein
MKKFLFVLVFSILIAIPLIAFAQVLDPSLSAPWWKVLLSNLLQLVFSILGVMASILVTVLLKKYGFAAYTDKLNTVLDRCTSYAEQMALQALKLNGVPMGSAAKLELALQFAMERAKELGLPEKGKEWWTKRVESWLGIKSIDVNMEMKMTRIVNNGAVIEGK